MRFFGVLWESPDRSGGTILRHLALISVDNFSLKCLTEYNQGKLKHSTMDLCVSSSKSEEITA